MMTNQEQIKMFGMTHEAMSEDMAEVKELMSMSMHIMSILSDAQHIMATDPEQARQFINKAKWYTKEIAPKDEHGRMI